MVYMLKFINTFDKFNPRPFPKNRKHSRNDPVALMYQFIRILQWFCCYFYSNVCIRQGFYSVEYFLFAFCLSSIFILLQHYTNNVTKIFFWFSEIFQKDLWVFSPLKASVESLQDWKAAQCDGWGGLALPQQPPSGLAVRLAGFLTPSRMV